MSNSVQALTKDRDNLNVKSALNKFSTSSFFAFQFNTDSWYEISEFNSEPLIPTLDQSYNFWNFILLLFNPIDFAALFNPRFIESLANRYFFLVTISSSLDPFF